MDGTADVALGVEVPLFWDSPEAAKLFGFSYQDGDDVHKGVQDIVSSLTRAQQSHDGYKHFVANILDRAPLTPIQGIINGRQDGGTASRKKL